MNTKYILDCWRCFADHELYLFPFSVFLVLHEKDDPILKGRVSLIKGDQGTSFFGSERWEKKNGSHTFVL